MAADPRIERLRQVLEDSHKNPFLHKDFDKEKALHFLEIKEAKKATGYVLRPHPEKPYSYLLIFKFGNKPFINTEDILVEISKDGYLVTMKTGVVGYPTIEAFTAALENTVQSIYDDFSGDALASIPSVEDYELGRKYFAEWQNDPPKELQEFLEKYKLEMENLTCSINFDLMRDPVVGPEADIRYERDKITEWLSKHTTTPIQQVPAKISDYDLDVKVMMAINILIARAKEQEYGKKDEKEKSAGDVLDPSPVVSFSKALEKIGKDVEAKKKAEEVTAFKVPEYQYDEARNLFNLAIATEALLKQIPDKAQEFKPRVEMDPKDGALYIDFTGIKIWETPDHASLYFLKALKMAGVKFVNPRLSPGTGKVVLRDIDVIKFAEFCKMPQEEIEFMYTNRNLGDLYTVLNKKAHPAKAVMS